MNIFFVASIRGGRTNQHHFAGIVQALEQFGTVSSKHVSDETLSEFGETRPSAVEIRNRELYSLNTCDVVVAEVTTPSLGVGYLIAHAALCGKKVVALYHGENTFMLSAMLKGDPRVEVHTYTNMKDIERILYDVLPRSH